MAIQNLITKNTKFSRLIDIVNIFPQFIHRIRNRGGVFYRYKTQYLHPCFERYYDYPPVPLANSFNASIFHWINSPKFIHGKPFIIEISDHPFSAVGYICNEREPEVLFKYLDSIKSIYAHPNCKFILMTCLGMKKLFNYYFSDDLDYKIVMLPQPGCISKPVNWNNRKNVPIKFVCLASNYTLKGVDLLIAAWNMIDTKMGSTLVLACPNIPVTEKAKILKDPSIILVEKAPLTDEEKSNLLSDSHVTIAPTHIHGVTNIVEGIEFGHAIIYFEYHVEAFKKFGTEIEVPYHFYKSSGYGEEWKTFNDFLEQVKHDKTNGVFDVTINSLTKKMKFYIENKDECIADGKNVYDYGMTELSYSFRNDKLRELYKKI